MKQGNVSAFSKVVFFAAPICASGAAKVDFKKDVQPIFRANCIGCHGPTQQKNGFRLDRRSAAMRGGTLAMIGPGNAAASRLYLRLIGSDYGMQMPPTGPLGTAQIETIKNWIDQGAEWPDDASGETPAPPPDAKATQMMHALREGDAATVQKALDADPKVVTRKGPGGAAPLMYAVLYSDTATVRRFLEAGADPNVPNDAGATALMWAAGDVEKTRLLLDHGANVNARSDSGRTALLIAAGRVNNSAVVKLLLERGANPSVESPGLFFPMTPLAEAASTGDPSVVQVLLDHGADAKAAGLAPGFFALATGCARCGELVLKPTMATPLAVMLAPPLGPGSHIPRLLEMGADANAKDPGGAPLIVLACSSDASEVAIDSVRSLIAHGADVNAKNAAGESALDLARKRGNAALVKLLVEAGAKESAPPAPEAAAKPAASARAAVARSIPLLQKADSIFVQKAGCVSCHNDSLEALTVSAARKAGLPVNNQTASANLRAVATYAGTWRERSLQGIGIPGDADTMGLLLVGLAAENYAPDATTDAMAAFLKSKQIPNGMWPVSGHRPPLESSSLVTTVLTTRALELYTPKTQQAEYRRSVDLAKSWIAQARPQDTQERAFQLLGFKWTNTERERIRQAGSELLAQQRTDGGWPQISSLASDAYATGQALYALYESGVTSASDPAFQRGVRFLINSQLEDGSWHVRSRAAPIQPYFESGFPHGHDQWISAAATSWATLALIPAAR